MSRAADSAGRPWEGRTFTHHDTAYAGDDGSAPAGYLDAVGALAADAGARATVVDALRGERLLVPLLAAAGETGVDERGRTVDKTQELSIVTVQGPDGAGILPMFSHVGAMQSWNAKARPVPTSVQRAAAAALDGPGRVVVDPGSESEFVLTRTMLEALLTDAPWSWGVEDAAVHSAVAAALFTQPSVQAIVLATGDPRGRMAGADLEVHALVDAAEDAAAQLQAAAAALGEAEVVRERIASVAVRMHRWDGGAARVPLVAPAALAITRGEWQSRD
ncbi:SseB protein N-terminal domain-containing protein [Agrococcus baldri]|uniref:SseB protein N-terminal domain-containing protein n=1 Tax=Agrococcus baldri TaxID=153730 RepID=A0AA94HJS7_9MICO|nr:SseB family protein [Agrococcus baldri]SFR97368.1 SseB protein N-terminal domain-containing protein [Agrococcus baldri]